MSGFDLVYEAVKGPLAYLWPILVLPLAAALLCELAARRLPPTRADWRVAAALAAAPGALFLALAAMTLWTVASHGHYDPAWQHFVKYQVAAAVAVAILGRAMVRAWGRHAVLARLIRLSASPEPRLALAARRAGVEARTLPCSQPECFVAGAVAPIVYVSAGAVARLSDSELVAAMRHEAAHVRGRDTAVLSLLGFLRDLAPVGAAAINAYCQARERSADEAAMRASGPVPLASALLALARGPERPLPAIGIAGIASPAWRLRAILGAEEAGSAARRLPAGAALSLAVTAAFAAWPTAQQIIIASFCNCHL